MVNVAFLLMLMIPTFNYNLNLLKLYRNIFMLIINIVFVVKEL